MSKILSTNLKNEFSGRESQIRSALAGAASSQQSELFISAPNIYLAVAVLLQGSFYVGRGDVVSVINRICSEGDKHPVMKEKLRLIVHGKAFGRHLFKDNN